MVDGPPSKLLIAACALPIVIFFYVLTVLFGVLASLLFIPYLQVGAGKMAQVPPFVVQIAWGELWTIYAVLGAMLMIAVGVLIVLLVRMKVFEAVKLGEVG